MGIDFSAKNTKNVAIQLYNRIKRNNYQSQILVMPTGTGKTAVATATAGLFAHAMQRDLDVFIIAPKSKLAEDSWRATIDEYNEIAKYKLNIYEESTPQNLLNANKYSQLTKQELHEYYSDKQIEKMSFFKTWAKHVAENPTFFIIDEAHLFKNATSKRSRILVRLIKNSLSLGLSATPMSNGYVKDGVNYLVMNGFYRSNNDFENQHDLKQHYDKYYKPDVFYPDGSIDPNRFKYLDTFFKRISQTIYAPVVEIDFDMPDTETFVLSYDIDKQTHQIMKEHHKSYRNREYDNYMQYLFDLRNAIALDMNHRRELAKILIKEKPKQPLIFYYTNKELEAIEFTLQKSGWDYSIINGQHGYEDLDKSIIDQAIVIQYASGASAIEFKDSNCSIFYGLQYSWQDTKQAFGRNVRRGMTHDVNYYFTVATSVYDNKILEGLKSKSEFEDEYKKALAHDIAYDDESEL